VSEHTVRRAVRRLRWWGSTRTVCSVVPTRHTRKIRGDRSSGGDHTGEERGGLVRGRDDAAGVPTVAGRVGAAWRAGGGDDQRQERTAGVARVDQRGYGRGGAAGAGAQSRRGQCGARGSPRGTHRRGAQLAGVGQRTGAPFTALTHTRASRAAEGAA
jgi:hypothetical protein